MINSLKYHREKQKLSLAKLAGLSGYGKSTIGNFETGRTEASNDFIDKMCAVLRLSKSELLSSPITPSEINLVKEEADLSKSSLQAEQIAAFLHMEADRHQEEAKTHLDAARQLRQAADLLERQRQ